MSDCESNQPSTTPDSHQTVAWVLHRVGDANAAAEWRREFAAVWGPDRIVAPTMPGHADAAPIIGGTYQLADGGYVVADLMMELGQTDPGDSVARCIVGVGANGWSAQLVALAGRAAQLVLIDGLGGPFLSDDERVDATIAELRTEFLAVAGAAGAGLVGNGLDPRLAHATHGHRVRLLAEEAADATEIPTLIIETGQSGTDPADAAHVAARYRLGRFERMDQPTTAELVAVITEWSGELTAAQSSQ